MNNKRCIVLSVAMALMMITVCFVASDMQGDDSNDAVVVHNEDELRSALKDNANIQLAKDVCLLNDNLVIANNNVTIDGKGFRLTCNSGLGKNLVEIRGNGCVMKNIQFDCYNSSTGVCVKNADDVVFDHVSIIRSTTCALTVDMSNVKITSQFSMEDNGSKVMDVSQGNYIRLAWTGTFEDANMCSVTFDPEDHYPLYKYDGINVSIAPEDLSNAEVTKDTFRDKFSVKDGTYEFSNSVYGSSGNETVILNNGVASVDGTRYASLGDAVVAAMGTGKTVELTQDVMASGFALADGHGAVSIDFKEYKYTIMNTMGVQSIGSPMGFVFGTGGKISIANGSLDCIDPATYIMLDARCDIDISKMDITVLNIVHPTGSNDSDTTYGLSVKGSTVTLNETRFEAKCQENANRTYRLTDNATMVAGKNNIIIGDALIEGNSSLTVEGKYQQDFAVLGRGSLIELRDGTITMKSGSHFGAEVYVGDQKDVLRFEFIIAKTDSTIKTDGMKLVGSFETDGPGSVMVDNRNLNGGGMHIEIALSKGIMLTLQTGVNIESDLVIPSGAEFVLYSDAKLYCYNGSRLVLESGCTYKESEIRNLPIFKVDSGGTQTEQKEVFFVGSEHAKKIFFDGKAVDSVQIDKGVQVTLDLSRLSADVEGGYRLTGWTVDGVTHWLEEEIVITENSVVTPITEKVDNVSTLALVIGILIAAITIIAIANNRH